ASQARASAANASSCSENEKFIAAPSAVSLSNERLAMPEPRHQSRNSLALTEATDQSLNNAPGSDGRTGDACARGPGRCTGCVPDWRVDARRPTRADGPAQRDRGELPVRFLPGSARAAE